jgi:tRNA threonylcarbamoyladenosine biosynthesis protein TsaB
MSKSSKNIIIGLETGLDGGGISILDNENTVDSVCGSGNISKSEDLLSLLEGLLEKNAIKKREIGLIAVSDGPGSLTGIRIGLALAKGLGDALSVPVRYISILDAMAALTPLAKSEGTVLSVLSTMKNGNYLKEYSFRDGKLRIESEIIKKKKNTT